MHKSKVDDDGYNILAKLNGEVALFLSTVNGGSMDILHFLPL